MKLLKSFDEHNNFNNVIVPLSLNIDKVVFLTTHKIDENRFNWCKKIIKKYKQIEINYVKVDEETIKQYIDENTIVDVSVGKYVSLLLCEQALKQERQIIYFDEEERCIKDYKKHSVIEDKLFKLDIEDIITLNGGKILSSLHNPIRNKDSISKIYETIDGTINNYSSFISFVSKINSLLVNVENKENDYYLSNDLVNKIKNDQNYLKFKELALFTIDGNVLSFYNSDIKKLFMVSGAFLENYIYNKLLESEMFDDVKMSITIEFSNQQNVPVTCELDCLILKDNNLLFTSIKSNKVCPDDLNEIKVHNLMFGNIYTKPVICIYNELSENRPQIYAKAEELGVYVVEECMFKSGISRAFLNIINNTYSWHHII